MMKKMIAVAMAAMLTCAVFAGCGGSGEQNATVTAEKTQAVTEAASTAAATGEAAFDYAGTWVVVKFVTADGQEYGLTDYAAASGTTEEDATITYSFTKDGKATCTAGTVGVEGTCTVHGNEIQTTFSGSTPTLVYNEETGELCLTDDVAGITTYYAKMN